MLPAGNPDRHWFVKQPSSQQLCLQSSEWANPQAKSNQRNVPNPLQRWRERMDVPATRRHRSSLGFKAIRSPITFGSNLVNFRHSLKPSGLHSGLGELEGRILRIIEDEKLLGAEYRWSVSSPGTLAQAIGSSNRFGSGLCGSVR